MRRLFDGISPFYLGTGMLIFFFALMVGIFSALGGGAIFRTMSTPSGTSPVADSPLDTLTFATSTGIAIVGNADADSITIGFDEVATPADEQCATWEASSGQIEWETCGASAASVSLDLGDDGNLQSTGLTEIATTGDTNSIFTEPSDDKLLIALANNWPSADTADALDADPSDCAADTFADSIAANGDLTCNAVTTNDITDGTILEIDLSAIDAAIDEECLTFEAPGFEWQSCSSGSGTVNTVKESGATVGDPDIVTLDFLAGFDVTESPDTEVNITLDLSEIVTGDVTYTGNVANVTESDALAANPTDCSAGTKADAIAANGNLTCTDVDTGDIQDGTILEEDLSAIDAPGDEECLTFESPGFEWQTCGDADQNLFETFSTPSGTSPVADTITDTLTFATSTLTTITGNSGTDTITIGLNLANTPTDEFCLTFEADNEAIEFQTCTPGGGGGTISTIKEAGSQVGDADIVTLDFLAGFDLTESPDTEINISLDLSEIVTGDVTYTGNVANVTEADALAADPTDCAANQFANAIAANGDLTCSSIDISDDTNLAVSGTLLDLTGDTLSINEGTLTDNNLCDFESTGSQIECTTNTKSELEGIITDVADFAEADGDVFTGVHDFGGATSLEIPNSSTGTVVNASGEVTIDTTLGTFNIAATSTERVITARYSKGFVLLDPVATDDFPFIRIDETFGDTDITLVEICYLSIGGTNWVGQLQEADANGGSGVDVHTVDITAPTGVTQCTQTFSNAGIDNGDWLRLETTSISATPTSLSITFYYTIDPS